MVICNTNFADKRKHLSDISLGMRKRSLLAALSTTTGSGYPSTNSAGTEPPTIYFVTPTYPRREQIAELTRLGQTLMHVPHLHWIVADDSEICNTVLDHLLNRFGESKFPFKVIYVDYKIYSHLGIPYTHIASPMPDYYRTMKGISLPRGVANRRAALNWLRTNNRRTGVLYFGDDDNTFDLRLFSDSVPITGFQKVESRSS